MPTSTSEPENPQEDLGSSAIWENERHVIALGWLPPVPLERPNFTDAEGRNVGQPWSVLAGGDWAVFVNDGTDLDGWQYGSYFHTLKKDRPGGRASMRITDGVRSRRWTRLCDPDAAAGRLAHQADEAKGLVHKGQRGSRTAVKGRSLGASPHTDAAVSYGGTVLDRPDAKMRALKGFFELLRNALADKGLSGIPMDPLSYAVLIKKHTKDNRELQARIEEAHRMRKEGDHVCESMRRLMRDASVRTSEAEGPKEAGGASAQQAAEGRRGAAGEEEPPMLFLDEHRGLSGFSGDSEAVSKLLHELEAAVVYSRAAYGYALSAGYLSSVHSAIFMGTLKNIQFDVAGGASAEANNKALMMETGVQDSDLLLTEWRNSVCRPCHFLAADRKRKRLILSIRGSLELADLMTDGKADTMEVPLAGLDGKVHEGFFAAATFVHCNTHSVLEEASERYPGWPLLVTGHSLGGGVAALLAMLLNEPGGCPPGLEGRVRCVAVACPSVTCGALSRAAAPYVTSLVFRHDFVPRLSAANIDLLMQELVEASPIRNLTKNIGDFFTSSFAGKPGDSDGNSGVELQQWREDSCISEGPLQPDTACLGPGAFAPWWMMAAPDSAEAAALAEPCGSPPWPPPDMPPLSAEAAHKERQKDSKDATKAAPVELRPSDAERESAAGEGSGARRCEEPADVAAAAFEANTGIHISKADAAPCGEDAAEKAAAGEDGGAQGNRCPHGTGGVTKFDLLHPAGRCLWIVKAEDPGKERKNSNNNNNKNKNNNNSSNNNNDNNSSSSSHDKRSAAHQGIGPVTEKRPEEQGPADTAREPADEGTCKDSPKGMKRDSSSQRILDMMEQAWNSSGFGGGGGGGRGVEAPAPKKAGVAAAVDQRLEEACREAASQSSSEGEGGAGERGTSSNGAKAEALKTPIVELAWTVRFLECPPETFGRLHLHPEMINDHLPDSYASAVGQLADWWRHRQQLKPEDPSSAGGICIHSTAEGGSSL